MVEFARAGTKELKEHFELELKNLREAHLNIKERVGDSQALSDKNQSIYYSSWHYLAVHVLVSLGDYTERTISLYQIVQKTKSPEFTKHRDNVRATILDRCEHLLADKVS